MLNAALITNGRFCGFIAFPAPNHGRSVSLRQLSGVLPNVTSFALTTPKQVVGKKEQKCRLINHEEVQDGGP